MTVTPRPKLNLRAALQAKCHTCMGAYLDGCMDCRVTSCPLYSCMPFAELEPIMTWVGLDPRRQGDHPKRAKRELTEEQRAVLRDRLKKARAQ